MAFSKRENTLQCFGLFGLDIGLAAVYKNQRLDSTTEAYFLFRGGMEQRQNLSETAIGDLETQSSSHQNFRKYANLLVNISKMAALAGYEVKAFNPNSTSKFSGLDESKQELIQKNLRTYLDICSSAIEGGLPMRENGLAFAWWAIKSFNLRPLSDAFSHLQKNDIVEIYDQDHVQIFRTFDFLKCVSYSLDEVHTHGWWELYERDESVTQLMMTVAGELVKQNKPFTLLKPFPKHFVKEKFSERRRTAEIESRFVSTLVDARGVPRAYMNAFRLITTD